jgi:hypothetical protein
MISDFEKLKEYIESHMKPDNKRKRENGEIFTPLSIVNEMIDKLDEAYIKANGETIFRNPSLKWFDPAVGIGNFLIIVYQRLMRELDIPEEERSKHILENMLYMSELDAENVKKCKKIFGEKLNIYEGDTLEMTNSGFDVILGNPPYNKNGISSCKNKAKGKKRETLWDKFVEKSLEWLKPNGYLVFITPLNWVKVNKIHDKMLNNHIIWLKVWDDMKAKQMIKGEIPMSLFILQNTSIFGKTEIISELKRKNITTTSFSQLQPKYFIPFAYHDIFNKLIHFIETYNCKLEINKKTTTSTGKKVKLPQDYKLEDKWAVDTYIKEGIMVKKETKPHPDTEKRKLIIANKTSFDGAFIDEGKLSLTGNDKFYILGDNLELILKMLSFEIFKIVCDCTKTRMNFLCNEAFTFIPDLRKLGITDIEEENFCKML